jgi:hypothetical protein
MEHDMKSTTKSILAAISAIVLSATAFGAASQPPDQPVLIDTSSSAGSVVASSSSSATYSADHAFDGNWSDNSGRWLAYNNPNNDYGNGVHGESPMYLVYKFNTATKVNVLRLRIQNANEWDKRSPKAWTFLGSNDGTTWTTLDTRSGVAWASGTTVKTFAFANETKYEYYKFNCTEIVGSNNYMQLYEIQFLHDAGIVLTDLTSPSGTVTTTAAGSWVKPAKNAFDNGTKHNNDDRSICGGTTVDWIYTFDTPTKVNAYKVYAPGTGPYFYDKRMPKTWTFEAKNAGDATWTVLDTQSSETGWTALESRYYEFLNNTVYDSYRFAVTANQAGSDNYIQIDELEFFYVNRGIPVLGAVALARTGALAYSLSATEDMNAADLAYILNDGVTLSTNGTTSVNEGGSTTWTLSGFASADTTYQVSVLATNANDKAEKVAGTLYTGELTLGATANANEYGLVAGGVTVSRASADPFPLTVNYAISGSTGSEGTTWAAPAPVTIPANASSVVLPVVPLIDGSVTEDVTITVTLAAGNYEIPASASATLTLVNLVAPSGYNVWVAQDNGLASVASNWSAGHAPTALEKVLFDGDFSTKNCEWDAAASATVSNWTQNANYTGTVTFDTEFPSYANATFTLFTITGDCEILGGKWSCRGNYNNFGVTADPMNTIATAKRWCLNVSVGGAMTIASGASVTVTGRGYGYPSTNPGASQAYGGYAHGGATTPYGSITEPFDPGMGCVSQTDQKKKISGIGGGAVKLTVAGNLTVDGSIVAIGTMDQNVVRSGGTGGSIWIAANQISGSGKIDASACPSSQFTSDQAVSTGSGGRIALYTQSPLAFPMAKVSCNGTSYAGTSWNSKTKVGGPGTIYVKDPTQTHGTLYVKQSRDISTIANKWTGTPVMGDLELDAVVLSGNAQLRIPAGTSLTLPSLSAVTTESESAGISGIICAGGTLDIGNGDQVLKTNVAFSSPTPFSFPGNLTLETGARLGSLNGVFSPAAGHFDTNFTLAVAGDLDIPSGAVAGATRCCSILLSGTATRGGHGGSSLYNSITVSNAYDSVLNPFMTGSSTVYGFRAGGVFNLTVGGTLTLDGTISADGSDTRGNNNTWDGAPAGSAGSLNLRLGALSGSGSITAQGGSGAYNYAGGTGGGRVAVRLTGNGLTFSDHWKANITAYGVSFSSARNAKASSAGTVYLQEAANAESAGFVLIRNDLALQAGAVSNLCATLYPGVGTGCDDPAAFKKTSLVIAGAAKVKLTHSMNSALLAMENDTVLDLNGKTLTVLRATLNGTKLLPGTYSATDAAVAGFVTDTAADSPGSLVVSGSGTVIMLR